MNEDAIRWNARYCDHDKWLQRNPKQLLLENLHLLPAPGLAFDVASGTGINGLVLAEMGFDVISYDISYTGLSLAERKYREKNQEFKGAVVDISSLWLPTGIFDVILNFSFLERKAMPMLHRSLKKGGLFFFETLRKHGDYQSNHYLNPGEVDLIFPGYDVLVRDSREFIIDDRVGKISDQIIGRKR